MWNSKFQEQPFGPNLHHHVHAFLWTKLKMNFRILSNVKSSVWFWYIVDIFFVWTHGRENHQVYLDDFTKFRRNVNFTHETSEQSVTFLDFKFNLIDEGITTDLHNKTADKHQYLHFSSSHPDHTKRSRLLDLSSLRSPALLYGPRPSCYADVNSNYEN